MSSGAALLTLLVCGEAELCSESRPALTCLGKQRGAAGKKQVGVCFLGLPSPCAAKPRCWVDPMPQSAARKCTPGCCWSSLQLPEPARAPERCPGRTVSVTPFPGHLCLSRADPSPRGQAQSSPGGEGSAPSPSSSAGPGLQPPACSSLASRACLRRAPCERFGAGWCHLSSHSQWHLGGAGEPGGAARAQHPPQRGGQGSVDANTVTSLEGISPAFGCVGHQSRLRWRGEMLLVKRAVCRAAVSTVNLHTVRGGGLGHSRSRVSEWLVVVAFAVRLRGQLTLLVGSVRVGLSPSADRLSVRSSCYFHRLMQAASFFPWSVVSAHTVVSRESFTQ